MRRKKRLWLECLEDRLLLDGQSDFLVNTTLAGNQLDPAVAADGRGNFVVAWDGFNPANNTTDIFAQRFHPDGTPNGGEFVVNSITAGTQQFPKVAADTNGDFVVAWTGPNPANGKTDIWGRRFDSNGNAVSPTDVLLNSASEGLDSGARLGLSADGSLVVVSRTGKVGGVGDIYAQRYDGNLNPLAAAFRVNQTHTASVSSSRLAMDAAGNFVVTWCTLTANGLLTVNGRRFDNGGNALTNDLAVSGTPAGGNHTNLGLAVAPDGGFLALWDAVNPTTHHLEVTGLRFSAANQPGTSFRVSDPATSADLAAAGFDGSGNSVIVWQTQGSGSPVPDTVWGQRYDTAGNPSGAVSQLNVTPASDLSSVILADAAGGTYLAVWPSLNTDHTTDIRATLTAAAAQPPVLTSLTGTTTGNEGDTFSYHAAATDPNGDALTYSWDLNGDGVFGDATGPDVQAVFTLAGQHNVSVQVTDAHNQSTVGSLAVTVVNVPPRVFLGLGYRIHEGDTIAFQGSISDPGVSSETYTYSWDFNYDGQTLNSQASGATPQHTFLHPGTYQVAAQVLDNQGGVGLGETTVTVLPDAPTASAGADQSVVEGASVTLHGTFTDPDFSLDTFQQGWVVTRNGTTVATASTPDFTFTPPDSGTYLATFAVSETDGSSGSSTATISVTDASLAAQAVAVPATEGTGTGPVPVATFTDTGITQPVGAYSALIDWGDGTPATAGTIALSGSTFTVSGTHAYAEEGSLTVTATIRDAGSSSITVTCTATVADAALSAQPVAVAAVEGQDTGTVTVATFTDADPNGAAGDYSATIAWGDGSTSAGNLAAGGSGGFIVTGDHVYAQEGSFTAHVTIRDAGGSGATADSSVSVADAALTASGVAVPATEGASFSGVVASFTDADPNGAAGDYTATIAWGDGSSSSGSFAPDGNGGFTVSGSHTYAEEGSFPVSVTVADAGGSTATAGGTATVADAPLTATAQSLTATEGTTFSGVVASFTDADPDAAAGDFTATIAWGDGSTSAGTVVAGGSGGFLVTGSHTYAEEGTQALSVLVTDAGGSTATADDSAAVADASLTASDRNVSATEGTSFSGVVASFTDADPAGAVGDYTATITWGDGTSSAGSITSDGQGGFLVSGSHAYTEEGSFAVGLTLTDVGGGTATAGGTATVADTPLTASGSTLSATEGTAFSGVAASFTDANPHAPLGDFGATITWGDGSTSAGTIAAAAGGGFTVSGSHTYADANTYPVGVTITDVGGSKATAAGSATVADAALRLTISPITPTAGVPFGGVVATLFDANPYAPVSDFRATLTWGDGSTVVATVTANGSGGFAISSNHTYTRPGSYLLSARLDDVNGGNSATASATIAVSNPAQPIQPGQTAQARFWRSKQGQALIRSFNGKPNTTALANWLATTFPDLYGKAAGVNNLTGKTNTQVAAFFLALADGPRPHLQAQMLATALNVYATTSGLGGTAGLKDGFQVTAAGLGASTFNLGRHGAVFGVANNTTLTVLQILQAADQQATNGVPWGGNPDLVEQAHEVFGAINRAGAIGDD
jgi:hypothetical protein